MVMPANLADILAYLHPNAVPFDDFEVRIDPVARGGSPAPFIARWNTAKLGPQPSEATVLSAKVPAETDGTNRRERLREARRLLRAFDERTATAADVRAAIGALALLLRNLLKDDA